VERKRAGEDDPASVGDVSAIDYFAGAAFETAVFFCPLTGGRAFLLKGVVELGGDCSSEKLRHLLF
jgi:hypothetical protein